MIRCAVVDNQSMVVNIILVEDGEVYICPEGSTTHEVVADSPVSIGWLLEGTEWIAPVLPEPEPEPVEPCPLGPE